MDLGAFLTPMREAIALVVEMREIRVVYRDGTEGIEPRMETVPTTVLVPAEHYASSDLEDDIPF